jgi:branched-chain amino acid transport system ATP-binding protein
VLRIEGLSKSFGGLRALKNISLVVEKGRIHGIIGPNGSGKTTLFNCITGALSLDAGSVYFENTDISGLSAGRIANSGIRRTFQAGKLAPSLTVLENVMCGVSSIARGSIARGDMLEIFCRPPFIVSKNEERLKTEALKILESIGMGAYAERWAGDLSWAERQFVQIARAIISRPKLLLLDEPASGMAAREIRLVEALIRKIQFMGITVVVVSHNIKMLMDIAEWVTVLNFGEKIAEGKPEQIRKDPLVLEAYLGSG